MVKGGALSPAAPSLHRLGQLVRGFLRPSPRHLRTIIAAQMAAGKNVEGLEDSDYNDRNLLAARIKGMEESPQVMVLGSSRVYTFDHTMFGTDSFYNAGLSEATIYDLLAVSGILLRQDKLPETVVIGVDAFLFNKSHDNEKWKELEGYADYMALTLDGKLSPQMAQPRKDTGRELPKALSLDYFRYNVTLLPDRKRFPFLIRTIG